MLDESISIRMREDWNRRAREDAHYYVAFGKHGQSEDEFFDTAGEIVYGLEFELRRFGKTNPRSRRALEIGCGPGRLLKPLSRHFGEIHGVDVSDEMTQAARRNLAGIPHAHVHVSPGAGLPQFADESFDFVYSYAVFQHIPSKDVVFSYLKDARRVLKAGGLLWFQVNGLQTPAGKVDTWSGCRFVPDEITAFANEHDFQMNILEGVRTQYMWTSLTKRPVGWFNRLVHQLSNEAASIKSISNPQTSEPGVPRSGRFATASVWIENLPVEAGLNHMRIQIAGNWCVPNYIFCPRGDGIFQVNVPLPDGVPTGLVPVRVEWRGQWLTPEAIMRVVPQGPSVPRLQSVTDATDLLSGSRILSGSVRVTMIEVTQIEDARFFVDGIAAPVTETHVADPKIPQIDFVFRLPDPLPGLRRIGIQVGRRRFPETIVEVVG